MKKVIYSAYTKLLAVILLIVSVMLGALSVSKGIVAYYEEKGPVYRFENSFNDSQYLSYMLDEVEGAVYEAYRSLYEPDWYEDYAEEEPDTTNGDDLLVSVKITPDSKTLANKIEKELNALYQGDKINYYIKWNDKVFTNCGATTAKELMQNEFYSYICRDDSENITRNSKPLSKRYSMYWIEDIARYDKTSTIEICTSVKEDYAEECKALWSRQSIIVNNALVQGLTFAIIVLMLLIYLVCTCGTNKHGENKTIWIDNIWAEAHIAVVGGFGIGAVILSVLLIDEYSAGQFPLNLMQLIIAVSSVLASAAVVSALLSIIRNIKCKRFIETSIILRALRWCIKTLMRVLKWIYRKLKGAKKAVTYAFSQKNGVIFVGMLFAYTLVIAICSMFMISEDDSFVLCVLIGATAFGFACFTLSYRVKDLGEIKKGVAEVRNGNVAYKISELKSEDLRLLACNINDIAKGLDESVSAKVRAERLKTELITNVSHDLKTPITSIISYTELLSKIDDLSEEAKDYVSVILKKSERLKNLTQDLFDISKVQSGNENIVPEKLDVALLINQSLGEHDNEIQKSELPFCVSAPKELYIYADGRKLSRVIGNLINNILKYAMKNTRVFIIASEKNGKVVIEFKNIAAYPMEFTADEIVGRFVRGDESRTAEGNGLGLAIAKSYTEICGGGFEVVIDGDMFKTVLTFKKYI